MSDLLTDEQKAAIRKEAAEAYAILDAQRAEKGRWLRALIKQHPLRAANIIGTVCLILGAGLGYLARGFFS